MACPPAPLGSRRRLLGASAGLRPADAARELETRSSHSRLASQRARCTRSAATAAKTRLRSASIRLLQHQAMEEDKAIEDAADGAAPAAPSVETGQSLITKLTTQQIRKIRYGETALACGQILAGTCVSALTATGAAEMLLW